MFDNLIVVIIIAIVAVPVLFGLGYITRQIFATSGLKSAEANAQKILAEAKARQKELILEAKDEALKLRQAVDAENREKRSDLQRQERRLAQKEENLDRKIEALERREKALNAKETDLEQAKNELATLRAQQLKELERVSGLSTQDAKDLLLKAIEGEIREEASRKIHEIEAAAKEEADRKSREIVSLAIQRCAADHTAETTVSVVPLPNDEMKGRIIGREGRNIRALEQATGVDLIIDDTPEAVVISAFDPIRREVARVALNKLILDGRIHPARVEEMVIKAKQEVDTIIRQAGEEAAFKAGVHGLHPDLIKLLGRLKFRTSYGQNVLQHSIEVAALAEVLASELKADVNVCRRAGLLHDIGKAVDHEVEGPHASIGADIARRMGKSPKIVHAIAAHHADEEPKSVEAVIIQAADAISASRPGARGETLEAYIKRLQDLEKIADSFPGVEKSFAIQAGREIRIIVKPEDIDDLETVRLSRDIVKKIEENLDYPGQIRVTVIREIRAVDYAK